MTLTWYKAKIRSFTVPLRSHAELVTLRRVNGSREDFEANVELRWSNLIDDLNYIFFLQARQSRSRKVKKLYFKKKKTKK
jgi:hypothetical protein